MMRLFPLLVIDAKGFSAEFIEYFGKLSWRLPSPHPIYDGIYIIIATDFPSPAYTRII